MNSDVLCTTARMAKFAFMHLPISDDIHDGTKVGNYRYRYHTVVIIIVRRNNYTEGGG